LCGATRSLGGRLSFDLNQGPGAPGPLFSVVRAVNSQNWKNKREVLSTTAHELGDALHRLP
jgi:hypothetical protein